MRFSFFAGGDATNNIGSVLHHLLGVKGPFTAGKALNNDF